MAEEDGSDQLKKELEPLLAELSEDRRKTVFDVIDRAWRAWTASTGARTEWWLKVLQSAPFYFFFGLILLLAAFVANSIQANSSLTFLIAMLGVAIVLYGTGSQAAGTLGAATSDAMDLLDAYVAKTGAAASMDADLGKLRAALAKTPAGLNVAIAGGAAVLTAVFGFGVVYYQNDIREVFRDWQRYTIVRVDLCVKVDGNQCRTTEALLDKERKAALDGLFLETDLGVRAFGRPFGNSRQLILLDRESGLAKSVTLGLDDPTNALSNYTFVSQRFVVHPTSGKPCTTALDVPTGTSGAAVSSSSASAGERKASSAELPNGVANSGPRDDCNVIEEDGTPDTLGLPFYLVRATLTKKAPVPETTTVPVVTPQIPGPL